MGVWYDMEVTWYDNHPNGNIQRSQGRKNDVKFDQIWRFFSMLSSISMTWCIMNSCHKVVRSIRITTLKLCAVCVKQFVRNAMNCGKINHGFCTIITYQLTHRSLCNNTVLKKYFLKKFKITLIFQPHLVRIHKRCNTKEYNHKSYKQSTRLHY